MQVVLVLVIAVVAVAVARPQNAGRPTLFNRPNRPGAVLIPQGMKLDADRLRESINHII